MAYIKTFNNFQTPGLVLGVCILLSLVLLFSCKDKSSFNSNGLVITKRDSVVVELPYESRFASLGLQHYVANDSNYCLLTDLFNQKIIELNISRKKDHLISIIDVESMAGKSYPVFQAHRLDSNHIIIQEAIDNHKLQQDSAFYIINNQGEVVQHLQISHGPLLLDVKEEQAVSLHHFGEPWRFFNRRLVYPLYSTWHKRTEQEKAQLNIAEFCYFDISLKDSIIQYNELGFTRPHPKNKYYSKKQLKSFILPLSKRKMLVSYANREPLYKINLKDSVLHTSQRSKTVLDQPVSIGNDLGVAKDYDYSNNNSTTYLKAIYDSSNNRIFRFALPPIDESINLNKHSLEKQYWIGEYNEKLNVIGQGKCPDWFTVTPQPVFINGRLLSLHYNEKKSKNLKLFFSQIKKMPVNRKILRDSLKNVFSQPVLNKKYNFSHYIKKHNIPGNSVILVIPQLGCPYCINKSMEFIFKEINNKPGKYSPLYVITDSQNYKSHLPRNFTQNKKVIFDESKRLQNSLDKNINNPTLMYWDGQKISQTIIMSPSDINSIRIYTDKLLDLASN